VDLCGSCGGAWFDAGELDKYLDSRLSPLPVPAVPEIVRSDLDRRAGKCPRGHGPLQKRPAPSNPRLTLDVCGACGGSWVDGGELEQASGKDLPFADRMKAAFGTFGK
jgi:Zn-finger nucleic acid-binding protein